MPEREFYLWQVRTFTVRLAMDLVETLGKHLKDRIKDQRLNPAEEHGGLLFGRIIDINNVEVTGFECIPSEHHRGSSYDLGVGERSRVERYVKRLGKRGGPKPVGFFRTHLRPGLFLDQSDFALMTESFSDIPGVALAIRADQADPWNAGMFFWEEGDIDRSRTSLMFPFDAANLRVQGPVEYAPFAPAVASRASARFPTLKVPFASLAWGTAVLALFIALAAEFNRSTPPDRATVANPRPAADCARELGNAKTGSNTPAVASRPAVASSEVPGISSKEPEQTPSYSPVQSSSIQPSSGPSASQPASPPKPPEPNVQLALNKQSAAVPVASVLPPAQVSLPAPVPAAPQPASPPKPPDTNVQTTVNKELVPAPPPMPGPPVSLPALVGKSPSAFLLPSLRRRLSLSQRRHVVKGTWPWT